MNPATRTNGSPRRARALATLLIALLCCSAVWAATGCDLNAPDKDVARLFPGSTRYATRYFSLTPVELSAVVARLGTNYRVLYDPLNVPYTLYEIYVGNEKAGYIHGVNQKGQFGGIQVFVALDLEGRIKSFYVQKMTGASVAKFRAPDFGRQFTGVTLKDFDAFDPVIGKGTGRLAKLQNPAPDMETDFYGVLRAVKKNLVLMDAFVYSKSRKSP